LVDGNACELRTHGPVGSRAHSAAEHHEVPSEALEAVREVLEMVRSLGEQDR
jgi:hypothetical protein